MLPDRVSNPGPLTYESGALPIALRGPTTGTFMLGFQNNFALAPRALKPHFHNWCSNSRIRSDACFLTNTATKTQYPHANGIVVFESSPFRYNNVWFYFQQCQCFSLTILKCAMLRGI